MPDEPNADDDRPMTAATLTRLSTKRRPVTVAVHENASAGPILTIGVDVGGTKTACVVTDADDRVIYRDVVPTDSARLAAQLVEIARRAMAKNEGVLAIGIAVPGQVEPGNGAVDLAVNLGGGHADLGANVESGTGLPCFVEHDARAAAAWVYERAGSNARGKSGDDLCYLSLGTGIAAGIVLDGKTLRGESGLAGEVGHSFAEPDGPECACGLRGCLESVASGPAIARKAHQAVERGEATTLTRDSTAADVFAAAQAGDDVAQRITERVSTHLARAIRGLVLTLGVRRVVLGGGVAASGDALLNPLLGAIAAERRVSQLVESVFAATTLDILEPGLDPGARGAAAIARRALFDATTTSTRTSTAHREGVGDR
ncbi:MAG: ROK family protein [Candidatus Limnocylindrales bacterium]